ncbi:MAG: hypothetical protein VKK59_02315 [Vampirovibrionales bacterium]|nr:hypothetical protein [Vampirovibrionales bacterium]
MMPTAVVVIGHWLSVVLLLGSQLFMAAAFWSWLATAHGVDGFLRGFRVFRPFMVLASLVLVASGVQQLILMGGMRAMPMLFHIKLTFALIVIVSALVQSLIVFPKWQATPRSEALAKTFWILSLLMSIAGVGAVICLALAKGY